MLRVFFAVSFASFFGALVGWIGGLIVAELLHFRFRSIPLGVTLLAGMLLLGGSYLWIYKQAADEIERLRRNLFKKSKSIVAYRILGLALFLSGVYGLWSMTNNMPDTNHQKACAEMNNGYVSENQSSK